MPQVDRIRWHLFPEMRLKEPVQLTLDSATENANPDEQLFPDDIRIMDLQQERLARNLGDGHRIIHGVAGSGKTLILGYRCRALVQEYDKPILVLCFNVTLAARLREMTQDLQDKVSVFHFHDWCAEQLKLYHVKAPTHGANYVENLTAAVNKAVEQGHIPRAQYRAIMIDEGHDFKADWLKLIVGMIDPVTNSLLFLYDTQSLYNHNNSLDFAAVLWVFVNPFRFSTKGCRTIINQRTGPLFLKGHHSIS